MKRTPALYVGLYLVGMGLLLAHSDHGVVSTVGTISAVAGGVLIGMHF